MREVFLFFQVMPPIWYVCFLMVLYRSIEHALHSAYIFTSLKLFFYISYGIEQIDYPIHHHTVATMILNVNLRPITIQSSKKIHITVMTDVLGLIVKLNQAMQCKINFPFKNTHFF